MTDAVHTIETYLAGFQKWLSTYFIKNYFNKRVYGHLVRNYGAPPTDYDRFIELILNPESAPSATIQTERGDFDVRQFYQKLNYVMGTAARNDVVDFAAGLVGAIAIPLRIYGDDKWKERARKISNAVDIAGSIVGYAGAENLIGNLKELPGTPEGRGGERAAGITNIATGLNLMGRGALTLYDQPTDRGSRWSKFAGVSGVTLGSFASILRVLPYNLWDTRDEIAEVYRFASANNMIPT